MQIRRLATILVPLMVILGVVALVARAGRSPLDQRQQSESGVAVDELRPIVETVNAELRKNWEAAGLRPMSPASDLQVLRRISLALVGTTPSLEELRGFESDRRPDRLSHWTRRYLADRRFSDYFAERLARGLVGTDAGQFIVFRRDRFVEWLSEQIRNDVPYDQIVRTMIEEQGLWTGQPAVNFITAAVNDNQLDCNKLAGRTVRVFLGQRIDCAQCHDHPFASWKQHQFEGLAAFYGQTLQTIAGIEDKTEHDGKPVEFEVEDRKTLKKRTVTPAVPFGESWQGQDGTRRHQLASWITHPENRRFERSIANRVWGLMFGRPYLQPVDDLPDPGEKLDLLDLLGRDFREHGYSLKRLIQVTTESQAYRLQSQVPEEMSEGEVLRASEQWAVFPLIRLRPEQVIRSMRQAASIQTYNQDTHLLIRIPRYFQEFDFIREYGDLGDNELQDRGGTIPQRLLMMNGEIAQESLKVSPVTAAGRIASLAPNDQKAIETAFLICLCRHPDPEETAHFLAELDEKKKNDRDTVIEDMMWSLFNSTEFSWNH